MQDQNNKLLQDALTYFNSSPILQRLLHQFTEKYRSLGRIGGSVRVQILTPQERDSLSGLLGMDLSGQKTAAISAARLKQALQRTRFADLSLKEILFAFTGGPVLTRAEEKEQYEKEKENYFNRLARDCGSEDGRQWIEHIITRGRGSRGVHSAYRKDKDNLHRQLCRVLSALKQLPAGGYERLPVFAARITGDPHGFDLSTEQGRLLIDALRFLHRETEKSGRPPLSSEEHSELLAAFGILRDDIFSFVTCTGLLAFREKGIKLATWEKACEEGIILNVPLREVDKIETLVPALPAEPAQAVKPVFVVENPGVFSEIIDAFAGRPHPPLICTHGQFRLAALLLLDKLAKSGVRIFYSGDFDPEGLQMAQRLLQRYPSRAEAWRYSTGDYLNTDPLHLLDPSRLNKLNQISHPALIAVKGSILNTAKAGYQEQIISHLLEDIRIHIYPHDSK